jgi:hypothetical protein
LLLRRVGAVMTATGRVARAEAVRALVARVDPADRPRLEARVQKAAVACGCSTGSVALLAAAVGAIIWWVIARDGQPIFWTEAGVTISLVIAATVFGKLVGLVAADVWLLTTRRRLERRVGAAAPARSGKRWRAW